MSALLLASCGGQPPAGDDRSSYFGINAQHLLSVARAGEEELLNQHLTQISELEVGFVRANANWGLAEPQRPTSVDRTGGAEVWDTWVEALAEHGLRWQPTVIGLATPSWATDPAAVAECGSRSPPARPHEFGDFAASIAARFGRDGQFWRENPELEPRPVVDYEIWNSPNYGFFWCPAPDPEGYGALYAAARAAIRDQDPEARVIAAGLGPFEADSQPTPRPNLPADEFISRMLSVPELGPDDVDVAGIHLYGPDSATLIEQVRWFRGVLESNGLHGTPMVVAEAGWATMGQGGPPPIEESERAAELSAVTQGVASQGCGVIQYSPHTWTTPEGDPTNAEHWYGIARLETAEPYATAERYEDDVEELQAEVPRSRGSTSCTEPAGE